MDYFILKQNDRNTQAPVIKNWFGILNKKYINRKDSEFIQEPIILEFDGKQNTQFVDILTTPFFLISKRCKDIISAFSYNITFKQVLLVNYEHCIGELYFLPILDCIDCLIENKCEFNFDKSVLKKVVIDEDKTNNIPIFKLGTVANTYIIVKLDIAECMVCERLNGYTLLPIETQKGGC